MAISSLFSFFTDAILRGPTIGCMLMSLAASLIGVIVFLKKQSLIGEALSHAAYPGIILGVIVAGLLALDDRGEIELTFLLLLGAFLTALLGLWMIQVLIKQAKVPHDAALCFVLSIFFGVGLTLASEVQFSFTIFYKQVLTFIYGQAATMRDIHILIYGVFAFIVLLTVIFFYKELQIMTFDKEYAKSLGIPVKGIDNLLLFLITFAVIIGIRSVGVILMSAMLIAPAVAARQLTNRLSFLFMLAAFFGLVSGFFGNYFSVSLTNFFAKSYPSSRIVFPTGPMIVLAATTICIFTILLAPERGLLIRLFRIGRFRYLSLCENILKMMWRIGPDAIISLQQIAKYQTIAPLYLKFILWRLLRKGWIDQKKKFSYQLTETGVHRAAKIVRLHRLWEVYLANYLGVGLEKVHRNAEEMEHILTAELEEQLTLLLNDPKQDPHQRPIPPHEEFYAH